LLYTSPTFLRSIVAASETVIANFDYIFDMSIAVIHSFYSI
jgi:hypothetical protein